MAKQSTWSDWWASRTIRFNTYCQAIYAAAIPIVFAFDEQDLTDLGLSRKAIVIVMAVFGVIQNVQNMNLRAKTDKALAGRAHVPAEKLL